MRAGTFVILHLVNPTEKFWGQLEELLPMGVTLRGISVSSFDDWAGQVARGETGAESGLGLVTMFVPLFRVERMFRDEQVGVVESYRQRFARRVGREVEAFLDADWEDAGTETPSSHN